MLSALFALTYARTASGALLAQPVVGVAVELVALARRSPSAARRSRTSRPRAAPRPSITERTARRCSSDDVEGRQRAPSNPSSPCWTARPIAVQAHDLRRPVERAEHDHDAAVLAQVGDRLDPAAHQVDVREPERAGDAEQAACRPSATGSRGRRRRSARCRRRTSAGASMNARSVSSICRTASPWRATLADRPGRPPGRERRCRAATR